MDRAGCVVAGNGTLEAARRIGWSHLAVVRTELEGEAAHAPMVGALADRRRVGLSTGGAARQPGAAIDCEDSAFCVPRVPEMECAQPALWDLRVQDHVDGAARVVRVPGFADAAGNDHKSKNSALAILVGMPSLSWLPRYT